MTLELITPKKKVFSGEISLVQLPGSSGSFEILNNHAPIISTLKHGIVRIVSADGSVETYQITGGVVEAADNKIIVLADKTEDI
ncbi:MAG: ATP synthase F1 subunit epsilon [Bacteroidia bacterium]|nr:ATP synthase F1 subunit epsilon [Bacteroidia bacterium]